MQGVREGGDDGVRICASAGADTLRLVVEGELDLGAMSHWDSTVGPLLQPPCPERVELDLGAVDFIDSSGLGLLIKLRAWAAPNGVGLRLLNVPRNVMRVLDFSGVTALFDVSPAELEPD